MHFDETGAPIAAATTPSEPPAPAPEPITPPSEPAMPPSEPVIPASEPLAPPSGAPPGQMRSCR